MDRRRFLRSLLTGLAGLPALAQARAPDFPWPLPSRGGAGLLLQESSLAGFRYYDGERVWPQLRVGQSLELRRRPDNRHDARAVEVCWRGQMLGHLPRVDNCAVSQLLDRGVALSAQITALEHSDDPWRRLRLAVSLA